MKKFLLFLTLTHALLAQEVEDGAVDDTAPGIVSQESPPPTKKHLS